MLPGFDARNHSWNRTKKQQDELDGKEKKVAKHLHVDNQANDSQMHADSNRQTCTNWEQIDRQTDETTELRCGRRRDKTDELPVCGRPPERRIFLRITSGMSLSCRDLTSPFAESRSEVVVKLTGPHALSFSMSLMVYVDIKNSFFFQFFFTSFLFLFLDFFVIPPL